MLGRYGRQWECPEAAALLSVLGGGGAGGGRRRRHLPKQPGGLRGCCAALPPPQYCCLKRWQRLQLDCSTAGAGQRVLTPCHSRPAAGLQPFALTSWRVSRASSHPEEGIGNASGLPRAPGGPCEPSEKLTPPAPHVSTFRGLRRPLKAAALPLGPGTGLHEGGNRHLGLAAGEKLLI